eukprot:3881954-Amphidinium_carterae.1
MEGGLNPSALGVERQMAHAHSRHPDYRQPVRDGLHSITSSSLDDVIHNTQWRSRCQGCKGKYDWRL